MNDLVCNDTLPLAITNVRQDAVEMLLASIMEYVPDYTMTLEDIDNNFLPF